MRRLLCMLLLLGVACTGCGMPNQQSTAGRSIRLYYAQQGAEELGGDLVVAAEERTLSVYTLQELLEIYFRGPSQENLSSPFPQGTEVLGVAEDNGGLELTLSSAFFTLQGVDMSIASCCLVQTVSDFTGVTQITLVDELDRIRLELVPEQFLLENAYNVETATSFTLYFAEPERRYLIAESREATLSENESPEAYVLREMMDGPQAQGLLGVIPEGTELLGVETEGGVCTVNFSKAFYENRQDDTYGAYTTIYSIVDTLTNLEGVTSVQFLIEGEILAYYGLFPIDEPLSRYAEAIGGTMSSGSELDVSLYVLTLQNETPFALPIRVHQSISQPLAEAVVQAAISLEPPQGFYNPIPYGTEVLGVSVSGSVCYVDLSGKFVPAEGTPEAEQAAVWALVEALTGLDNVSAVVLTIEGDSSGLTYVDISEPLTEASLRLG